MEPNPEACKALIAAILDQAFNDALSTKPSNDYLGARYFIDEGNWLFRQYCYMLDLEPEYVARRMQERIRQHELKPLKKFRE